MRRERSNAGRHSASLQSNGKWIGRWHGSARRASSKAFALLALLVIAVLATACNDTSRDLFPDKDTIGVPVGAVTHYGTGIEVGHVSIDDFRAGLYRGWGATNPSMCCVLLPRKIPQKPVFVTVKWRTNRLNVDESLWHEARVPINFAVVAEDSGGLFIHFLPGHRVEVWVSIYGPYSTEYPGPRLDGASAPPPYQPLPGELPEPPLTERQSEALTAPVAKWQGRDRTDRTWLREKYDQAMQTAV